MPYFVDIDPVALAIGPLDIHWYGIMYLVGFGCFYWLGSLRARTTAGWTSEQVSDLLFYGAVGVILGGRLGYILFYDLEYTLANPIRILQIWNGGMSFHGGLLGVFAAMAWFARKTRRGFWEVADFVAPLAPPGLLFGRIGNFIGGELWGRHSDAPWAMIFPSSLPGDIDELRAQYAQGLLNDQARHPSQLYEAALEGLALFLILWFYTRKPRPTMAASGAFLIGYGAFRIYIEQFRQPDAHLEFIALGWVTMGMVLSLPLVLGGVLLVVLAYRRKAMTDATVS